MSAHRNLLIVVAHGLRSDALSDARAWPLQTPHIEGLARRGLRLCLTSACPNDPGALMSLLTGLHPRQHGCVGEQEPESAGDTIATWLREAGYHVAGVGCVGVVRDQLDEAVTVADVCELEPVGCDYWTAAKSAGLDAAIQQQRRQRLRAGPFEPDRLIIEPDQDIDGFIATEAVKMVERMPFAKPWALLVVFSGPGNDLPPAALYDELIDPAKLHGGFVPLDQKGVRVLAEPVYPRAMLQRLEPNSIARIRADYLGRVSMIDYGVRRLVDASDRREDRTQTWTMLSADRGHLLGEHGLVGHRSFLAGAIEVPLVFAPPRDHAAPDDPFPEGLFSTVDIAATLAALSGADRPPEVTGRSLLPLFNGDPVLPASHGLLSEFNDRLLLETERYKVVFERKRRRCMGMYDLLNDPDEKRNLIDLPAGQNVLESLRCRLADALLPLRAAALAGV